MYHVVPGHIGGLTNPCPGAENVEPVIVNTSGPRLSQRGGDQRKKDGTDVHLIDVYYTTDMTPYSTFS